MSDATRARGRSGQTTTRDAHAPGGELVPAFGRFGMLSEYVMDNASHGAQALYGRLAMMSAAGEAWPGLEWLAGKLGVTDRTVRRWCAELRQLGVLRVQARFRDDGSQTTNRYLVGWSPATAPPDTSVRPPRTPVSAHEIDKGEIENPPTPRERGAVSAERQQQVDRVVMTWQQALHPKAKPTRDRTRRVLARLRDGYTADELVEAILGCAGSQFHRDGHHTDLALICRDAPHVDRFRALYADQRRQGAGARGSSPAGPRLTQDQEALRDLEAWLRLHPDDEQAAAQAVVIRSRIGQPTHHEPGG